MDKKTIVQIIPSFAVAGAEKVVLDYLRHYDRDKYKFIGISLYGELNNHYTDIIRKENLEVYYLDKKKGIDFSIFYKIKSILRKIQPDIIHSHMYALKYIYFPISPNIKARKFHTIHNEPEKDAKGLDRFANKIAFKFLGVQPIGLTAEMADKTNELYNTNNSLYLNNGIFLDHFYSMNIMKSEAKKRLGLFEDSYVVGHIGRFSEQKNHEFIIKIFYALKKRKDNAILLLVGDGSKKSKIENLVKEYNIENSVIFLGVRKDIPEIFKAMDIFLFPSLHEGFSITLVEAQASSLKCVVSNTIDNNTFLTSQTIPVSLEKPIEKWVDIMLDNSISNNVSRSLDDFDISDIMKKLYEIYFPKNR